MALERQVPSFERVEVVEPNRERDAEAFRDLGSEDARGLREPSTGRSRPRWAAASPRRIPLSGVISSYDQARLGASVSMPRRRRSHCPPHGPGRNVGRVRKGRPARRCNVERSASPESEQGPPGIADLDVTVDGRRERLLVPSRIGQSTKSRRCSEPASPGGWPRFPAAPRRTASRPMRFGTSAYQSRSWGTSELPGPVDEHHALVRGPMEARRRDRRVTGCRGGRRPGRPEARCHAFDGATSSHDTWWLRMSTVSAPRGRRRSGSTSSCHLARPARRSR